jgi:hypothetical protein
MQSFLHYILWKMFSYLTIYLAAICKSPCLCCCHLSSHCKTVFRLSDENDVRLMGQCHTFCPLKVKEYNCPGN